MVYRDVHFSTGGYINPVQRVARSIPQASFTMWDQHKYPPSSALVENAASTVIPICYPMFYSYHLIKSKSCQSCRCLCSCFKFVPFWSSRKLTFYTWLLHWLFTWLLHCLFTWLLHCLFTWLLHCLFTWLPHCLFTWVIHCLFTWVLQCLFTWLLHCHYTRKTKQ